MPPKSSKTSKDSIVHRQQLGTVPLGEDFYAQVLNSLEDYAVFTLDKKGKIASWNTGAERLFGYSSKEILGQNGAILFTPEDIKAKAPKKEIDTAQQTGRAKDERWHVRKDGSCFWTSGLVFPLKDQQGKIIGFSKIARDLTERKQSQLSLKQEEDRFRKLINQSADAIQLIDPDGKIRYSSESVKKVLGYQAEEVVDTFAFDYLHPDDLTDFHQRFAKLLKDPKRQERAEYRVRHKDGSWTWVEATGINLLDDPTVGAIVGSFRNINDRHEMEKSLKQSEKRFRTLIEKSADVIQLINAQGEMIYSSDSVQQALGYTPSEILGTDVIKYIHPDDLPMFQNKLAELLSMPGGQATVEYRVRHKNGSWAWIEATGTNHLNDPAINAIVSNFRNITDRKNNEEKVGRLAAIVDSSYDAIISKNLNSIIQTWNKAAETMFGYTAEEAIGQNISITIPPELQDEERKIISNIRKGVPVDHYETVRMDKEGRRLDLSLSISPVRDSKGQVIGAANIGRDISERIRMARQKDDFIAIATHELKTPITSIKAYVQALHRRFLSSKDNASAEAVAKIDNQLNKMTNLIQDLLDVSRMGQDKLPLNKSTFSLDEVVKEAIETMQHSAPKHKLVIEGKIDAKLNGDADRISQVITNLLSNAIKYSPNADKVLIHCYTKNEQAIVGVRDFGVGIAPDKQQFVFDRFYRVSGPKANTFPGLGLGLYISSQIIQRHGGKIWLESVQGKGSTFYFSLPLQPKTKR